MAGKRVKVRIKRGHGIGGIGYAGEEVTLSAAEAKLYADYVEPLDEEAAASPQKGKAAQKVAKPQSKRRKTRSKRK